MTKLIGAFRDYAKAPKKILVYSSPVLLKKSKKECKAWERIRGVHIPVVTKQMPTLILILLANRANPALCWPNVKIPVHNLSLLGREEVIQLNLDLRVRGMNWGYPCIH